MPNLPVMRATLSLTLKTSLNWKSALLCERALSELMLALCLLLVVSCLLICPSLEFGIAAECVCKSEVMDGTFKQKARLVEGEPFADVTMCRSFSAGRRPTCEEATRRQIWSMVSRTESRVLRPVLLRVNDVHEARLESVSLRDCIQSSTKRHPRSQLRPPLVKAQQRLCNRQGSRPLQGHSKRDTMNQTLQLRLRLLSI